MCMSPVSHSALSSRTSNMSAVVIEFEGFQLQPNSFVIKELAFYSVKYGYHGRWCFLPPFAWEQLSAKKRKTNAWLIRYCHGLRWESGELPYSALQTILLSICISYTDIYVKGLEKTIFLEHLLGRKVLDLNDFNCPKMKDLESKEVCCPVHSTPFKHCALAKATAYASFINKKQA